jgi:hypothetical protein
MDDCSARTHVLVVGDLFAPEMRGIAQRLDRLGVDGYDVRATPRVGDALAKFSSSAWQPDLMIICQHWPDEFTTVEVHQLLAAFPLARLICCYGPWCASDGRTRDVWPLAIRVEAHCAARRIDLELEVLAGSRWPLPLTASRDEIFLFDPQAGIEAPAS